jgi:hypothetical protein
MARDALLSAHPWNFATAQARLSPLTTPPLADFATAFLLPLDCVRVLSAGLEPQSRGLIYRIAGRQLHADADDVVLSYVRRPREDEFPPFFAAALIACLSAEFCIPLTDSTARWEALRRIADGDVRRARLIDAQEETTPQFSDFSLVEERY